jgi:hypothetical protein
MSESRKRVQCPIIFRAENKGLTRRKTQERALQKLSVHSKGLNSKFAVSVHYKRLTAEKIPQNWWNFAPEANFPELCWVATFYGLFSMT